MSQELTDLRQRILSGQYTEALLIIDDLDEMSRKTTLRNIRSYLVRLLSHLIKNQLEQRLTNSWAASIRHSIREIQDLNEQANQKSYYLQPDDWPPYLEDAFEDALYEAAAEVFEGQHTPFELGKKINQAEIFEMARQMLADTYTYPRQALSIRLNERLASLPGGAAWGGE